MTAIVDNPAAQPVAEAQEELVAAPPQGRIRVGWIAQGECLQKLSRILQPLAIGLLDEVVEVVVVCPQRASTADLPIPPLEVIRHGRLTVWILKTRALDDLLAELAEHDLEVLHALDAGAARLTGFLANHLNLKYVLSSYQFGDGKLLGTLDGRCAAVLAAGEPLRRDLLEHHVASSEKILVVHPGVYQVRHTTLFENPSHSCAILACGKMDDLEQWEAVLRSFADLKRRNYDCVFFAVGAGKAEHALRRAADKMGLREALTFAGRQQPSQLAGILKAADIFISPTPTRTVDLPGLLAMAAGDPVLAAGGGCSDFYIDGKTALLYKPGDAADLTAKLTGLLDNHAAARALAEDALTFLREGYSPASAVTTLAKLYRAAAEK